MISPHNERLYSLSLELSAFPGRSKDQSLGMDSAVLYIASIIYDIRSCDQPDKYWSPIAREFGEPTSVRNGTSQGTSRCFWIVRHIDARTNGRIGSFYCSVPN